MTPRSSVRACDTREACFFDDVVASLTLRISVFTVLEMWLRGQHLGAKDASLLRRIREFAISVQRSSPAPTLSASARRLVEVIDSAVSISSYHYFGVCG
jgi:hypothetical protein